VQLVAVFKSDTVVNGKSKWKFVPIQAFKSYGGLQFH